MEVILVGPMRIARLAGQGFKGARDARQFQRAGLRDDEIAARAWRRSCGTAQEPAVVVGRTAARDGDVAERRGHGVGRDGGRRAPA
jgi:hypothetical protein